MRSETLVLFLSVSSTVLGLVVNPVLFMRNTESDPTCTCTTTVTQLVTHDRFARQNTCPPAETVTNTMFITITDAPATVTVADADPSRVSEQFASASKVDFIEVIDSFQDMPTGGIVDDSDRVFTHTASGLAIVATEAPGSNTSLLYIYNSEQRTVDVATATVTIQVPHNPNRTGFDPPRSGWNSTQTGTAASSASGGVGSAGAHNKTTVIVTASSNSADTTTLVQGVTSSASLSQGGYGSVYANGSTTEVSPQKRQTCTLIYAELNGQWASWCNNWDGTTTLSYTSWETTVIKTDVPGASPPPESVVHPSTTLASFSSSAASAAGPVSTVTETVFVTSQAGQSSSVLPTRSDISTNSQIPSGTATTLAPQASCGQVGTFVIGFEDLPSFSTNHPENEKDAPPIFNPYEHFYWSGGYGYGPPPNELFLAHDGSRLAEYDPKSDPLSNGSPNAGSLFPGSFGAGPRAYNNVYWFDAHSAWVGCNSTNSATLCDFVATAYRWASEKPDDPTSSAGKETLVFTQYFKAPPCPAGHGCQLSQVFFDTSQFHNLSSLNFYAKIGDQFPGFYVDTIELAWSNNTCEAGLARISSRK